MNQLLRPDVLRQIYELMIAGELQPLGEIGYSLEMSEAAVEFLVRKGFHKDLGARPMRDAVEKYIQDAVCRAILLGSTPKGVPQFITNTECLSLEAFEGL